MRIMLIFFLLISFVPLGNAVNIYQRRQQLLNIIDEELSEVTRLVKQTGNRKPKLLLRMAELLLEKARLLKEIENNKYLSTSVKKRRSLKKQTFFKGSRRYFTQAQRTCLLILKRFPRFKSLGGVYYIMAYNSKEFLEDKNAMKYFKLSIKKTKTNSNTNLKAKSALAEMYYNQQKYSKAISLYKVSLTRKIDKWWTKDSYNLAWCYFRTRNFEKAIKKMNEVYSYKGNNKYIDMSRNIERDMAYFYTEIGQSKKAIAFYKKIGGDIAKNLVKISKYLIDQGKFSKAEAVLNQAVKYKNSEAQEISIYISLLDLYERFGKISGHLIASSKLNDFNKQGKLDKSEKEILINNVKRVSAMLQKQVAGKQYLHQKKNRERKANNAISFFKLLMDLEPKKKFSANFLIAETHYAVDRYTESLTFYEKAFTQANVVGNKKIRDLALNGMTAALSKKGIDDKTKNRYLISAYINHLRNDRVSKKSYTIYQRLFNVYYEKNDIKLAEETLVKFKKSFPLAHRTQEAMLAKIMDYYRKKNDKKMIKYWVSKINSGEYKVSKKYAKKLKILLLTMQFENVENLNSTGDKKLALSGYVTIFKDKESSADAKKNAAYNIAVLFHELGDTRRTFGWTERAVDLMGRGNVRRFESDFLTIAGGLFNRNKFYESAIIYDKTYNKLCSLKSGKKEIFYKNAIITYLADGKISKAHALAKTAKKCKITKTTRNKVNLDILKAMSESAKWNKFEQLISMLALDKSNNYELIPPYFDFYQYLTSKGDRAKAFNIEKKIFTLYAYSKKRRLNIPLEGLDVIAHFELSKLEKQKVILENIKFTFPEKAFTILLKSKLGQLDKVSTLAVKIAKIGSGRGVVRSYKYLIDSYQHSIDSIRSFSPSGKSEEYLSSFRNSMVSLTEPIVKKKNEYFKEVVRLIKKNTILSKDNYWFLSNQELPIKLEYQYPRRSVIMDRGGR